MQRKIIGKLLEWKDGKKRLPLIIRGARQVGKTWLMKELGKKCFKNIAYVNFENNRVMKSLFEGGYDIKRLITALQIESGVVITPEDTLIIFDEVQESSHALASLKYFNEDAPEYAIIAAGSMLGVALHQGTSFPVGKVDFLDLYPLSFPEFLEALGHKDLVELLESRQWDLITAFKSKYCDLLRQYYYVGGMPEVVSAFIEEQDYQQVRQIQNRLLTAYQQDFSKYAPIETVPKIGMLWDSVPAQLAKENSKFIYGAVRTGARAKDFELALQWLIDCGLLHKVCRVAKPGMPLSAYEDKAFKLFMSDVGLLAAKSDLDVRSLLDSNRIFEEFKGSLTEQFVLQQLISTCNIKPYYWSAERATSEVDFIFQNGMDIIPLEVKAQENLKAKSLQQYSQKYSPPVSVRTALTDYKEQDWLVNLPLYAINQIREVIENRR